MYFIHDFAMKHLQPCWKPEEYHRARPRHRHRRDALFAVVDCPARPDNQPPRVAPRERVHHRQSDALILARLWVRPFAGCAMPIDAGHVWRERNPQGFRVIGQAAIQWMLREMLPDSDSAIRHDHINGPVSQIRNACAPTTAPSRNPEC